MQRVYVNEWVSESHSGCHGYYRGWDFSWNYDLRPKKVYITEIKCVLCEVRVGTDKHCVSSGKTSKQDPIGDINAWFVLRKETVEEKAVELRVNIIADRHTTDKRSVCVCDFFVSCCLLPTYEVTRKYVIKSASHSYQYVR